MNNVALEQLGLSKEQFAYFKEQGAAELAFAKEQAAKQIEYADRAAALADRGMATQEELASGQKRLMDQAYDYSLEDRQRYRDTAIPLQDRIINEANNWDSPERQAQLAAQAQADVQRQADAQQRNVDSRLAGMGIDPSQMRAGTIANTMGLQTAAAAAMQGNNARQQVQQQGIAMRGNAANIVAGLPAQGAQQQGLSSNAGGTASNIASAGQGNALNAYGTAGNLSNSAIAGRGNAVNNIANWTGTPTQWAGMGNQSMGMGSNSIMNAGNVLNSGYGNQMTQYNAKRAQFTDILNAGAGIAGAFLNNGGKPNGDDGSVAAALDDRGQGKKDTRTWKERAADGADLYSTLQGASGEGDIMPTNDLQQYFYADGGRRSGAIPARQSEDRVPAMLSHGEYVIPADVVRALGTRHFDKLVERHHRIGA
jgi:hypothetical protein